MKPPSPVLFAAVVAAVIANAAFAHAAELERAPELPDLSFRSVAHDGAEVAAAPGRSVAAAAQKAACPTLGLSGAKLSRAGVFTADWDVSLNGQGAGKIEFEGDMAVLKDGLGNVAAKAQPQGGVYVVTGCAGEALGAIELHSGANADQVVIKDAQGGLVGQTGFFDDVGFALAGPSGANVAKIDKDHWYSDTVTLAIAPGTDPRLVAIASVLNTNAVYQRASSRNSDRMGEGHGGAREKMSR